jgi:hypothetical protein
MPLARDPTSPAINRPATPTHTRSRRGRGADDGGGCDGGPNDNEAQATGGRRGASYHKPRQRWGASYHYPNSTLCWSPGHHGAAAAANSGAAPGRVTLLRRARRRARDNRRVQATTDACPLEPDRGRTNSREWGVWGSGRRRPSDQQPDLFPRFQPVLVRTHRGNLTVRFPRRRQSVRAVLRPVHSLFTAFPSTCHHLGRATFP